MSRCRPIVAALDVLLLGLLAVANAQSSTRSPTKESGSPVNDQGSDNNYRSTITGITPTLPGLIRQCGRSQGAGAPPAGDRADRGTREAPEHVGEAW
jgi:hypothetical protein